MTNLAFGNFQARSGIDTVHGDQFSIGLHVYYWENWAVFFRITDGRATGEYESPDGSATEISATTTTMSSGLQYRYELNLDPELTPYFGGGISLQNYSYVYEYPGSKIGESSGIGYGPLLNFGMRVDIAQHLLIIPSYQFETIYIKTESGAQTDINSSGLSLALVIRF